MNEVIDNNIEGMKLYMHQCPECKLYAYVNKDQHDGVLNIICPNDECDYDRSKEKTK